MGGEEGKGLVALVSTTCAGTKIVALQSDCRIVNWRASVASETLKGVKMKKSGMFVYLYICLDVRMSFCTLTLAFLC